MTDVMIKTSVNEVLANRIKKFSELKGFKGEEDFLRYAIVHYLRELDIYRLKSELFKETIESKNIMMQAWKNPMHINDALNILSNIGMGKTKEDVDKLS